MVDYPYRMQLAEDPSAPGNVARNAEVTFYDPADTAGTTPLTLKDPSGLPLANPVTTTSDGFIPALIGPVPEMMWKGAGYTGYLSSYEGLRDEAQAAADQAGVSAAAASASEQAAKDAAALVDAPADQIMADTFTNPATQSYKALYATYANGLTPETYGTTGDGTPYDQTPIGQAINALPATGGLVRLKAKTYRLGTRLQMSKAGTVLAGEGTNATIIDIDAAAFEVMASDVFIRDLTIRGDGVRSLFQLVSAGAFKNWRFENVKFQGVAVVPARLGATINGGGTITSGSALDEHIEFSGCEFTGYKGDGSLHIRGTNHATVDRCYFHDAGVDTAAGDLCKVSAGAAWSSILDSRLINGTRDAIDLFDGHQALVRGNTIRNMGVHGIEMKAVAEPTTNPSDRHRVIGNRIYNVSQVSTNAPAIQAAVPRVMIQDNEINGGQFVGIRSGKTTDNVTRANDHLITGNVVSNMGSHGFMGDDLDRSIVSSNISRKNGVLTGTGAGFWYNLATGIVGKAAANISHGNVTADRWPV